MLSSYIALLSILLVAPSVSSSPFEQIPFDTVRAPFDFKHHLAGISPYHAAGGQVNAPPEGCEVVTATYLIRTSGRSRHAIVLLTLSLRLPRSHGDHSQ